MTVRRAAFLDRDGVLNERAAPHDYVRASSQLVVLPRVREGVALLARAGFVPIVVSNQRGVARGLVARQTLSEIEERLSAEGIRVEAFYYCLHEDDAGCVCRKPKPGLLREAAEDFALDLPASVMIGDSETDVLAGRAVGAHTILITSPTMDTATSADATAPDLYSAAELVFKRWGSQTATART
jgi:histidinol-phosphate phosphatase family protein